MKHLRDDTKKKMEEDNFDVSNKQTDPDYEAIHFNRQRSLRGAGNTENVEPDVFDSIETASELDFSSHKRELVLGIDRKPEIKPFEVFKFNKTQDMPELVETLENVIDKIGTDINQDELLVSKNANIAKDSTSGDSTISHSKNPFLINQSNNFKVKQSVQRPFTPPRELSLEDKNSNETETGENKNVNSTAALIKQFNNDGKCLNGGTSRGDENKASTKQLINKFNSPAKTFNGKTLIGLNNNKKFTYCNPAITSDNRTNKQSANKKLTSNVQRMVSAFNNVGFPN